MRLRPSEALVLLTAIGLIATIAAPWYELRGTFAAWRIVEWHAFWRGNGAFQLSSVAASDYRVTIEYATQAMQDTLRALTMLGSVLAAWHVIVLAILLSAGARWRLRQVSRARVLAEIAGLVGVISVVLGGLILLFGLPSSITSKIDFRTAADIHTDSLIWSHLDIFLIAPALSLFAALGQLLIGLRRML